MNESEKSSDNSTQIYITEWIASYDDIAIMRRLDGMQNNLDKIRNPPKCSSWWYKNSFWLNKDRATQSDSWTIF